MSGPLEGFRVIDVTAMITGPLATMILGDQGADVIKIEPPGLGDVVRYVGTARGGMSAVFALCNRNKRSLALNLREDRGRELARELVKGADVFVQNFRPGVIERLGLDESTLRAVRPDLIYVSISAYGEKGPYASRGAYDHIIQGMSGMATVQADPKSGQPAHVKNAVCDKVTAYSVAQAITAALLARERGRGGQHLKLSMLDVAISFLWPDGGTNASLLEDDVVPGPPISATYGVIDTADGHISAAAITDPQAHGAFRALGRPEMVEDPRFATIVARSQNMEALFDQLDGAVAELSTADILARFEAEDVPCGPVLALDEVVDDPQVKLNGTFVEDTHPQLGRYRQPRPPVQFSATPAELRRPTPALGEHSEEVLAGLGLAASEIADLRGNGIVG